jgi:hypothetical protein
MQLVKPKFHQFVHVGTISIYNHHKFFLQDSLETLLELVLDDLVVVAPSKC